MKALILSLVIAFSSSFALANCPLADANYASHEGAYTRKDKARDQHNFDSNQAVSQYQQSEQVK